MRSTDQHPDGPPEEHPEEDHSLTTEAAHKIGVDTVEELVRHQLAASLGGKRGMLEAGIPGLVFTVVWLTTDELRPALIASLAVAGVAMAVRLLQRSTIQYVFNAVFGIGIGWLFVQLAAGEGSAEEQQLAFFGFGILWSLAYTVIGGLSCVTGWPILGLMLGAATEDPFGWHRNRQVVRLCSRLTWVMLVPGAIGVLIQGPIWLLGRADVISPTLAVALILGLRQFLGWALRIASWSVMLWLLARNATPLEETDQSDPPTDGEVRPAPADGP